MNKASTLDAIYRKLFLFFLAVWSFIYVFISVSELAGSSYNWGIGIGKHLSFLTLAPFLIVTLFRIYKHNSYFYMISGVYFLYLLVQQLLLFDVNYNHLYAQLSLVFFLLFSLSLYRENAFDFVLKALFVSLLISLIFFLTANIIFDIEMFSFTNRNRFSGGFVHAGKFSMLLLVLIILSVYLFPKSNLIAACLVIIFASQTRNVELSLVVAFAYYFGRRYKNYFWIFAPLISTLFLLYVFNDDLIYDKINILSSGRLNQWATGFYLNYKTEVTNVLFGTSNLISLLQEKLGPEQNIFHFDNSYLEIIIRDGIIGFILAILILIYAFNKFPQNSYGRVCIFSRIAQIILLVYFFFRQWSFFDRKHIVRCTMDNVNHSAYE